jgi:hypothetical protein
MVRGSASRCASVLFAFFYFPLGLVFVHRKFTAFWSSEHIGTLLQDMLCLQDHIRTAVILLCGTTCMARRTLSRATHLTILTYAMAQLDTRKAAPPLIYICIYIRLLIGSRCRS